MANNSLGDKQEDGNHVVYHKTSGHGRNKEALGIRGNEILEDRSHTRIQRYVGPSREL